MGGKTGVMVVDDHEFILNSLVALLQSPTLDVYPAESAEQALTLCKAYKIDVAFIDARMRPTSGIDLIGIINKKYPTVKIVGITSYNEKATISDFLHAGVVGYLAKINLSKTSLTHCLETVLAGQTFFSDDVKKMMGQTEPRKPVTNTHLSAREYQIASLLCNGKSAKEIADSLEISKNTVDDYKKTMLEKTGTQNSTELISFLHRNGLV
jgi:DNA-binding NarL/FixJ family response regulator